MRIAIAGATGVVGRHVVDEVGRAGHEAVPLARSLGVDVRSGTGLREALVGVDVVVDVLSVATQDAKEATGFFEDTSRNLLEAGASTGVGHHVALSIVGIDEVGLGYYRGKRAQESVVTQGPVPWSILRATQFHEFAQQILHAMRLGPVSVVPGMLSQPVAAVEVAQALVALTAAGPSGRVPDLAGPERKQMVAMARSVVRASGERRLVVPVPVPGAAGRAVRSGALTPTTEGPRGREAFEDWLARTYS